MVEGAGVEKEEVEKEEVEKEEVEKEEVERRRSRGGGREEEIEGGRQGSMTGHR